MPAPTNRKKPLRRSVPAGRVVLKTPLLVAARAGHVDVMEALIKAGADTKLKSQAGTTLLLAAASSSRVQAAKLAFQYDKNVTAVDDQNSTAMHLSMGGAQGNQANQENMVEMVQFLADIGVPMDEVDKRGRTPCKVGDGAPFDKPIQRMAEIIYARGGVPKYIPKEFVMPKELAAKLAAEGKTPPGTDRANAAAKP